MTSRRRATTSRKPRATASAVTALRCRSGGRPASARCFTITANATDEHWHRWPRPYIRDFHLLAHHLHDRAMCLAGLRLDHTMRPLSHREQQCLQCLMRGETPGQIAAALELSGSAVHGHLRTARRKLECATIEQAIAKARRLDLIQ